MQSLKQQVTIIGSGLAGPLLGISLVKRGYGVKIYERRPDMRKVNISAGRSINLALSTRGIHALSEAGLWERLQDIVIPMRGRMMHSVEGELTFQRYGRDDSESINSVSRAELNRALMTAAEEAGVQIHFQQKCMGYDAATGVLDLRDESNGHRHRVDAELVIGADGSASALRGELMKHNRFNYSQEYLDYGYKELTIPASPEGKHQLETNALHIWPRGTLMLIALPNIDGTFGCILFLPFEGKDSFAALHSDTAVISFFQRHFPDALELMPDLIENFNANPTGSMVTVRCSPWHLHGKQLLLGDAAHAIVPFFGQGLNCAFEDISVFLELLDRGDGDWERLFTDFEAKRKKNTDAIADLAIENFEEMRDKVADPHFLLKKKVELALQARFPEIFLPKYSMVTFHRIPYSVAQARGRKQDILLAELCEGITRVEDVDWTLAGQLIARDLEPLGTIA